MNKTKMKINAKQECSSYLEKLLHAMSEYDNWHCKFIEIQKNIACMLANDICYQYKQIKNKEKCSEEHYYSEDSFN